MRKDVLAKYDRSESDKIYKEQHEALDATEIEKVVDEAMSNAIGDDDSPLSDEAKQMVGLKSRFVYTTRTFYAADLAA